MVFSIAGVAGRCQFSLGGRLPLEYGASHLTDSPFPTRPPRAYHGSTMRRAIYPGSFDPITNGHLDVVERATHIFDEVIVAVAVNHEKTGLFSFAERVAHIEQATSSNDRIQVTSFDGLLVDFATEQEATALVRGLRAISDFEFEFQMALMNRKLQPEIETIFLTAREEYTYVSSSVTKEIARLGGDISSLVPPAVGDSLKAKFDQQP